MYRELPLPPARLEVAADVQQPDRARAASSRCCPAARTRSMVAGGPAHGSAESKMSTQQTTSTADITSHLGPARQIGKTGFWASRVGVGDLADRSLPLEQCVSTLRRALARGFNVVDTAPNYEDGYSERIVGQAVAPLRERIFLIDKIDHWDRPVGPQLEGSLQRLGLPSVDLFVFHALTSVDQWNALAQPGAGFDELATWVRSGQVRFRGISSHHPEVLRLAIESGVCDVVMLPIGPFVDPRYLDLVPLARRRGVGTISFKTFGAGMLLGDTSGYGRPLETGSGLPRLSVDECLAYTLGCDPDVALLGLSTPEEQDAAFQAIQDYRPLPATERDRIRSAAERAIAGKGRCWWNPA